MVDRGRGGEPSSSWLRARREEILTQWEEAARAAGPRQDLSTFELLDHIPALLDRLADMVGALESGRRPALPQVDAEQHARHRVRMGFELDDMVHEYGLLRSCILRLAVRDRPGQPGLELVHEALDRAVAISVAAFTEARNRTVRALERIASATLDAPSLDQLLTKLVGAFVKTTPAVDTVVILLREGTRLRVRASAGVEPEAVAGLSFEIGDGLTGEIAAREEVGEVTEAARDPRVESAMRVSGARALYGAPLLAGRELIGVAHMGSRVAWAFSNEDKGLFRLMAARASAAIQLHRLRDEATARALGLSQLEQLISVHPDFFCLLDRHRRFLYVSPALLRFWGKSAEEVQGKTHADLGVLDPTELQRLELDRVLSGATVRSVTPHRTADGEQRYLENIFAPVLGFASGGECAPRSGGGPTVEGIAGVTRDVTAQRRSEDDLKQALEFRERLIAVLGHDLRDPLASIKMGAQLLLRSERMPPAYLRTLARVVNSADRMDRMIGAILDFARSRQGAGIGIEPRPVRLEDICEAVVDELQVAHPDRFLVLERLGDSDGYWDPDRLSQVVSNLVTNALRYGSSVQPVTVRVGGDEHRAYVEVHNFGEPIAPDETSRIFQPFQTTSKASEGGLGVGLYIVREAVAAHGGRVEVESAAESGTLFRVVLPKEALTAARDRGNHGDDHRGRELH